MGTFLNSSIGKKMVMAVTGLALVGFLIAHLIGNLQVFLGADAFNSYAALLKSMPGMLWLARIGLLVVFLAHVITAFQLTARNNAARPTAYKKEETVQATLSSRYMLHTGVIVLVFVLVHLAHFTLGYLQPEYSHLLDGQGRHDVYSMLVHGFQTPYYTVFYIACICLLGVHLSHACSSVFQTLGFSHKTKSACIECASKGFALLIVLGYISIPLGVCFGCIALPGGM